MPTLTDHQITEAFRDAIVASGLTPPKQIVPDSKLHRFSTNGKNKGDDSGWYILHPDPPVAGAFGCWRSDIKQTWCAGKPEMMTDQERAAYRKRMHEIREQRDAEERKRQMEAALRAREIWDNAKPAPANHPYLLRKKVKAHGLRVDAANRLIMPIQLIGGGWLSSLQYISPDGDKWFLSGGTVKGGFFPLQREMRYRPTPTPIGVLPKLPAIGIIAEGFATAASLQEATGYPTVCALNKGNLKHLAQFARETAPKTLHLICGDNDLDGGGQQAAREAADICNGLAVLPDEPGTDWNDVYVKQGLEAVKQSIETAMASAQTKGETVKEAPPDGHSKDTTDDALNAKDSKDHETTDAPNEDQSKDGETHSSSTLSAEVAHLHTPPALAHEPNILERFGHDVEQCGVVGEVRCAKLTYLVVVSRLLDEPVSEVVKGISSSGKSFTVETTLKFFPDDALLIMTAMSERALVYAKEEFSHRTIVIYEASALREQREKNESNLTAYFVRSLLSEGRIVYHVPVRDKEQGFVTRTIIKKGPTNVILTTTATQLHGENETRLLSIPTNDSQEQTKAIMLKLAEGKPQTVNFKPWHELQNWLAEQKCRVVIPYAVYLAEQIPPVAVRLRRDFRSILRLIEAHAMLHQCTRKRDDNKCIVATEADYLAVRELVADLVADGVGATVPKTMRQTVEIISEHDSGEGVTVLSVSKHLKLDRSAAQRRIQSARNRGYLVNLEDKKGKPARYAVGDPLPDEKELFPLSLSGCVQHTPAECNTSMHSVSAEQINPLSEGVQVCTKTGEIKEDESEEVIDLVD